MIRFVNLACAQWAQKLTRRPTRGSHGTIQEIDHTLRDVTFLATPCTLLLIHLTMAVYIAVQTGETL